MPEWQGMRQTQVNCWRRIPYSVKARLLCCMGEGRTWCGGMPDTYCTRHKTVLHNLIRDWKAAGQKGTAALAHFLGTVHVVYRESSLILNVLRLLTIIQVVFFLHYVYYFVSIWICTHGQFGSLSQRKASSDRAALPSLLIIY